MPVEGFPDAEKHKICIRCRRWFEPEEGTMIYPGSSWGLGWLGLGRALRTQVAKAVGDETLMKFICHECTRKRRRRKLVVYAVFVLLIGVVMLLELPERLD